MNFDDDDEFYEDDDPACEWCGESSCWCDEAINCVCGSFGFMEDGSAYHIADCICGA